MSPNLVLYVRLTRVLLSNLTLSVVVVKGVWLISDMLMYVRIVPKLHKGRFKGEFYM